MLYVSKNRGAQCTYCYLDSLVGSLAIVLAYMKRSSSVGTEYPLSWRFV